VCVCLVGVGWGEGGGEGGAHIICSCSDFQSTIFKHVVGHIHVSRKSQNQDSNLNPPYPQLRVLWVPGEELVVIWRGFCGCLERFLCVLERNDSKDINSKGDPAPFTNKRPNILSSLSLLPTCMSIHPNLAANGRRIALSFQIL
jgi:hypothetical protein